MAIVFDGRVAGRSTFPSGYGIQANGVDSTTSVYTTGIDGRIALVVDPSGSGETVIQTTAYDTDALAAIGKRAELWYQGPAVGETVWWWWASYIPTDWPDNINFCVFQMHDTPDLADEAKPPTMLGWLDAFGRYQLWNAYDSNATTTPSKTTFDRQLMQFAYPKGRWIEWVMKVTWSATAGSGALTIWRDRRKVYNEVNQINTYNDADGPHWKQGVYDYYSIGSFGTRTQYGKGLVVGDTYTTFDEFAAARGSSATELEGFVTRGVSL